MQKNKPAGDATRRLEQAVERLGADARKTKILAAALCGFAKPVPDYEMLRQHLLRPGERDTDDQVSSGPRSWADFSRGF